MSSQRFVGRVGEKLEGALEHFKIEVSGKVCFDVGASTGGFTDSLLQRGATKVFAVDTAYGELAWKLRNDHKVVVLERTNILFDREKLRQAEGQVDIVTVDAGWTKAELVVPEVIRYLKPEGLIILLIKPQYEGGQAKQFESKTKRVLTQEAALKIAEEVKTKLGKMDFEVGELFPSTIKGDSGNQEYFVVLRRGRDLNPR